LVFAYIWPERTIDRLRDALRATLRQLAKLLEIPRPEISIEAAKAEAHDLIPETSKGFDQTRRYVELTQFEFEESPDHDRTSFADLEKTLSRAEDVFAAASSLTSEQSLHEWQELSSAAKIAESELRNVVAKRIDRAAAGDVGNNTNADLSRALNEWNETVHQSPAESNRSAAVSQIASGVQHLE
jgi:hypothetical protein